MPTGGNEITGRSQAGIHKPSLKVSIRERSFLSPTVLALPSVMVGKPPPKKRKTRQQEGCRMHVRATNDTETDDEAFSGSDDEVLQAYEKRWRILSSVIL